VTGARVGIVAPRPLAPRLLAPNTFFSHPFFVVFDLFVVFVFIAA
jgi:hypothetical protein